jgi:hypothetical protein
MDDHLHSVDGWMGVFLGPVNRVTDEEDANV